MEDKLKQMKTTLLTLATLSLGFGSSAQCTLDASFTWNISGTSLFGTNTSTGGTLYGTTYEWSASTLWDYDENSEFPMAGMPELFLICLTVTGSMDSTLMDSAAWCTDFYCDTVEWDTTTLKINTNEDVTWSVRPNPAESEVFINSQTPVRELVVFDVGGSLIYKEHFENAVTATQIDIVNWKPGIYLLRIMGEDGLSITRKIIKR